jgi:hypothetical protein
MEYYVNKYDSFENDFFVTERINCPNFKLIYCNIRSMRKNFNTFLLEFAQVKDRIDFIVMSEVWIGPDELDFFSLPGYDVFAHCNTQYRSGGVVCFVLKGICASQSNIQSMQMADSLIIDAKLHKQNIRLFCIYRLHEFREQDFLQELENYIQQCNNSTVFIGDLNINILSKNINSLKYQDLMCNNGFLSFVNCPTRITPSSESCLDHIYIKHKNINNFKTAIFDIGLTDHCVLGLKYEGNSRVEGCNKSCERRNIIDYDKVEDKLRNFDWDEVFLTDDVNVCYNKFHYILTDIVSSCSKEVMLNKKLAKAREISPWITNNILDRLKRRKKLFKVLRRRPYDIVFKSYYDSFCRRLQADIDSQKRIFYSDKFKDCEGDSSRQWKLINNLTGAGVKINSVDKIAADDGSIISDPQCVADTVNEFLINVVQSDNNCTTNINPSVGELGLHISLQSFFINPVIESECLEVIKSLKNKKSSGYDGFNVVLLKKIAIYIVPVLTYIINLSFSKGIFPDLLKHSIVTPIFKKNKSISIDNVRPISLLSIFSKIFEKLMRIRLVKYLEINDFFSSSQFGFQKGKSTEDALISFASDIYNGLNKSEKVTGLFIDFKRAFDLVSHEILLKKLEAAGVRGVALDWFRSFLTGREQRVRVRGCLSAPLPVTTGVPQGSVTSATLFLIFINDLLLKRFCGKIIAFADDIAFLYSNKNLNNVQASLETDLSVLRSWCTINKMQVNVSKTKYINFSSNSFVFPSVIKFHEVNCLRVACDCGEIEKVDNFKYLGVMIDSSFTWKTHIDQLHNKLKQSIRKFYFLRNYCDEALLRSLYFALIHSRLQYGVTIWGGTVKTSINKLRVTQNVFIRIIKKKNKRESSFPLFQNLKILPIQNLFVFKVLRLFYLKSGNTGTENLFYITRSLNRRFFRRPKVNKEVFRNSFLYLGPSLFNKLPPIVKECNSLPQFTNKLKNWLFEVSDVNTLRDTLI